MPHPDCESNWPDGSSRRIVVIADDLTGACDSGIAFANVADAVRVHIDQNLAMASSVTVISTNSRDLPADEADKQLADVARKIPSGSTVFKKIDSVFRGNTFKDIAASVELFPAELAIVAPAYPAMGRRLRDGLLQIENHGQRERITVRDVLEQHGLSPAAVRATADVDELANQFKTALVNGTKVVLCDATEDAELAAIVKAAEPITRKILWIGSGGLAHALAGRWPRRPPTTEALPSGEVMFFIGSDHPVTRGQQVHLQRMSGIGSADLTATRSRVVKVPRSNASEEILSATRDLEKDSIGCLFMTGGDTALATCEALGIASLRLQREFLPGVPLCIAEGGRFDGVSVVLKSGGFGERDLLCRVLDSFAGKDCAYA